jgi:hypothetical protein
MQRTALWILAIGLGLSGCKVTVKPPPVPGTQPDDREVEEPRPSERVGVDAGSPRNTKDAGNRPSGGPITRTEPLPTVSGTYDTQTALPELPRLENVVGTLSPDSVSITFLPVDGAKDYRVYALPEDTDIVSSSETVHIQGATYRCAGNREVPDVDTDDLPKGYNHGVRTLVDNQDVSGYRRSLEEAQLGHVYYSAGSGRAAVYVLGDPDATSDNLYYISRVIASRTKRYTTSMQERTQLLAAGWRDDGIAFYVPEQASAETQTVSTSLAASDGHSRFYFVAEAEGAVRDAPTAAFQVLKNAAPDTQPLYRVHYTKYPGSSHDELAYGKTLFERVRFQGSDKPMTELLWTGVTKPTTLVVEALDALCPYAGRLSGTAIPGATVDSVTYREAITPQEAQARAPFNELYINGQSAAPTEPRALARAFLKVEPQAHETFDWFAGFETPSELGDLKEVDCGTAEGQNCFQQWRQTSAELDVHWHTIVTGQRAIGVFNGELWVRYADWAADTNGKFRLTPTRKARIEDDAYLHTTMEVTSISTSRRYPQIMISDRAAPIQDYLEQGQTILLEVFRDFPNYIEIQICDHRRWEVNEQCPFFQFYERKNAQGEIATLAPVIEIGENTAPDKRTRFDFFVSSKRAYVFVERKPYGCVDLPATGSPRGEVTVTFGDVLYHSGIDGPRGYHKEFLQYDTERRFDNLGFSSGVPEPEWDYDRLPCVAAASIDIHR